MTAVPAADAVDQMKDKIWSAIMKDNKIWSAIDIVVEPEKSGPAITENSDDIHHFCTILAEFSMKKQIAFEAIWTAGDVPKMATLIAEHLNLSEEENTIAEDLDLPPAMPW